MVDMSEIFRGFALLNGFEFTCQKCPCGGSFTEEVSSVIYTSLPPKKDFKCPKCGAVKMLREEQWPHTRIILGVANG